MVTKKPSATAEQRRTNVSQDFDTGGTTYQLLTKRSWSSYKNLQGEVNKLGVNGNHWDDKYDRTPYKKDKGWQEYLMDNNVDGTDKDDSKAEKKADDKVDVRIGSVVFVWAKATITYYHNKATTLVDNVQKKEIGDDLKEYMNSHQLESEKAVYKDTQIKNLIKAIEKEAKKGGGTTTTTTGADDFKNVGFGQRYYGNADLESVGFCMRYLKTN